MAKPAAGMRVSDHGMRLLWRAAAGFFAELLRPNAWPRQMRAYPFNVRRCLARQHVLIGAIRAAM